MANNKSAVKRAKIAERNRLRNRNYKSAVRTLMKKYFALLDKYAADPNEETLNAVHSQMSATYSKIDKAIKRGVLHQNNGDRKKARLAKAMKRYFPPASTPTSVAS